MEWKDCAFQSAFLIPTIRKLGMENGINNKKAKVKIGNGTNSLEWNEIPGLVVTPRRVPKPRPRSSQTAPRRV